MNRCGFQRDGVRVSVSVRVSVRVSVSVSVRVRDSTSKVVRLVSKRYHPLQVG